MFSAHFSNIFGIKILHSLIVLVSFLHVLTGFSFFFTCEYKVALRKSTGYIYQRELN